MRPKLLFFAPIFVLALLIASLGAYVKSEISTTDAVPIESTEGAGTPSAPQDMREVEHAVTAVKTWNEAVWYGAATKAANDAAWYEWASRQQAARPPAKLASSGTASAAAVYEPSGNGSAEDAVRQYFGDIFDQAWGVSGCESGHDPSAISPGGGNYGLFQINYVHAEDFEAYTGHPYYNGALDPYLNAMYARKLYNGSGWGPWACKWAA